MKPCIQTYSGKMFNLIEPTPEMIDIRDIAHALANIGRFNGHTKQFYSVAQHCVIVSALVPDDQKLAGLLHDATEAYLGDVTAPLKHQLPAYIELENKLAGVIAAKYGIPAKKSDEVHKADMIALVTEARDLMGTEENKEYWDLPYEPLQEAIIPWTTFDAESNFNLMFLNYLAERGDI
jgi:5'-deoxynucleotidase YfbR-like HD superfamily hydrolase